MLESFDLPCKVCNKAEVQFIEDDSGLHWAEYCPRGCYHTIVDANVKKGPMPSMTVSPTTIDREELEKQVSLVQTGKSDLPLTTEISAIDWDSV